MHLLSCASQLKKGNMFHCFSTHFYKQTTQRESRERPLQSIDICCKGERISFNNTQHREKDGEQSRVFY